MSSKIFTQSIDFCNSYRPNHRFFFALNGPLAVLSPGCGRQNRFLRQGICHILWATQRTSPCPIPFSSFNGRNAFYTQAFDWSVDSNNPMNYRRIDMLVPLTLLPDGKMTSVLVDPQGIPQPPTLSKYHIRERMNASVWIMA